MLTEEFCKAATAMLKLRTIAYAATAAGERYPRIAALPYRGRDAALAAIDTMMQTDKEVEEVMMEWELAIVAGIALEETGGLGEKGTASAHMVEGVITIQAERIAQRAMVNLDAELRAAFRNAANLN